MHFKEHFFTYIVFILLFFLIGASYLRFIVYHDYTVSYEGDCNPYTESCFVECEDEECTEEFYFSIIERPAYEVYEVCGPNVLECGEAYECSATNDNCSITFCDPVEDGDYCEDLNDTDV
jgi:hypothetical protein